MDTSELICSASIILNQWTSVQDKNFDSFMGFMTLDDDQEHWSLPTFNSIKIHIGAAIFEQPMRYNYAFIISDHGGQLIKAFSRCSMGRVNLELEGGVTDSKFILQFFILRKGNRRTQEPY